MLRVFYFLPEIEPWLCPVCVSYLKTLWIMDTEREREIETWSASSSRPLLVLLVGSFSPEILDRFCMFQEEAFYFIKFFCFIPRSQISVVTCETWPTTIRKSILCHAPLPRDALTPPRNRWPLTSISAWSNTFIHCIRGSVIEFPGKHHF